MGMFLRIFNLFKINDQRENPSNVFDDCNALPIIKNRCLVRLYDLRHIEEEDARIEAKKKAERAAKKAEKKFAKEARKAKRQNKDRLAECQENNKERESYSCFHAYNDMISVDNALSNPIIDFETDAQGIKWPYVAKETVLQSPGEEYEKTRDACARKRMEFEKVSEFKEINPVGTKVVITLDDNNLWYHRNGENLFSGAIFEESLRKELYNGTKD